MPVKPSKFLELAREAGFTEEQADFLILHLSPKPHTHTASQITDFDDAVDKLLEAGAEEEDEEEE